jgi:hypothetical protein
MVKRAEKTRMAEFVVHRLEDSLLYKIRERDADHVLLKLKANDAQVYIVLHNRKRTLPEYNQIVRSNIYQDIHIANIFYKDDETFCVRLGARGHLKGDERSLKKYSKEHRDRMVTLRGLEKEVLSDQNNNRILAYFQPETERLEEAVVGYDMVPVEFDYSHIRPDMPGYGFAREGTSKDFKIANEQFRVTARGQNTAVVLYAAYNRSSILVLGKP